MGREFLAVDLATHRIDQEWYVVVHDIDDRVRRCPTVLGDVGIEYPDLEAARWTLLGEFPQAHGRAVERFGRPRENVLGRNAFVDGRDESPEIDRLGRVEPFSRMGDDLAKAVGLGLFGRFPHFGTVGQRREKKITRMSKSARPLGAIGAMVATRKADLPLCEWAAPASGAVEEAADAMGGPPKPTLAAPGVPVDDRVLPRLRLFTPFPSACEPGRSAREARTCLQYRPSMSSWMA